MNLESEREPALGEQDPQDNSKRAPIIMMIMVGLILFIPLIIFLFTTLATQTPSPYQQTVREEDLFKAPYVADELIVELKEEYTLEELTRLKSKFKELGVVTQQKAYESDVPYLKNYYLLKFKSGTDLRKVAKKLENFREIKSLHPNFIFEANEIPNDNLYPQMWGLSKIDMLSAWNIAKGSNNVRVAVIDTGLDYNHVDFQGRNIVLGKDFATCSAYDTTRKCISPKLRDNDPMDNHGHGTHVSGTIAAVTNNSIGVAGINWNVTLIPLRAVGAGKNGDSKDIVDALQYAIDQQVDVVNMSISADFPCNHSKAAEYNRTVADAVSQGIVVVVAAGNSGSDVKNTTPASCDGVIAVGSRDQSDKRASSSNWGGEVDISAPGVGILSTLPAGAYSSPTCNDANFGSANDGYGTCGGTSMASPHVTGVAALLLSLNPNLTPDQVRLCLVGSADPIQTDRPIGPRLNAFKTLQSCSGLPGITGSPTLSITTSPSPTGAVLSRKITGTVLLDNNGNGVVDAPDTGQSGVQFSLGGPVGGFTTSNNLGKFEFLNLPVGTYKINLLSAGVPSGTVTVTLLENTVEGRVTFLISPSATPGIEPTPIVFNPTIIPKPTSKGPSPTPVEYYTCRERDDAKSPLPGSIKIGNLVCERI